MTLKKENVIGYLINYYKTGKEKSAQLKKQFSEDVCREKHFDSEPICKNRPPETTNLMNACLSYPLRETCKILFVDGR